MSSLFACLLFLYALNMPPDAYVLISKQVMMQVMLEEDHKLGEVETHILKQPSILFFHFKLNTFMLTAYIVYLLTHARYISIDLK